MNSVNKNSEQKNDDTHQIQIRKNKTYSNEDLDVNKLAKVIENKKIKENKQEKQDKDETNKENGNKFWKIEKAFKEWRNFPIA
jgi:hypothetical protein